MNEAPIAVVEPVKTKTDWRKVKHFKPEEFGPYADSMDPAIIYALDELRFLTGKKIIISRSHDPLSAKTSQHQGFGAVDILFPGTPPWKGFDLLLTALRIEAFKGFGIYREWKYNGQSCAGLHLDIRTSPGRVMWLNRRNRSGENEYRPLSFMNMVEFFPEAL